MHPEAIPGIGQPDAVAYRYGAELRRMIFELGLTHITLVSAQELQGLNSGLSSEASEEEHIAALSETRARLLAHTVSGYDLDAELKFNVRSLETYLRYMKLLEAELDGHPCMKGEDGKLLGNLAQKKIRKHTARVMLGAGLVGNLLTVFDDLMKFSARSSRTSSILNILGRSASAVTPRTTPVPDTPSTCFLVRPEQFIL